MKKTINAIDKDAFLQRLYSERRQLVKRTGKHPENESIARYDFAICAIENEESTEAMVLDRPEKTI